MNNLMVKDRSFYKSLLSVAVPISLQSLVNYVVQLIDTVMLGRFGEITISASTLANSFFSIVMVTCFGINAGASVITGQYWGKGEIEPIRSMSSIAMKITLAATTIFTVVTLIFPTEILSIYSKDAQVISEGATYLRILAFSFVLFGLSNTATSVLRSTNNVKISLYAGIGACLVNIFFNWALIFGNLGFPAMGIAGAAIATVLSRVFEFVVVFGYYVFYEKKIAFRLQHLLSFDKVIFRSYVKVGLPVLISDLVMVIGNNIVTIIMGHIGAAFTAANSIATQVYSVISYMFQGVGGAAQIFTGNTVGRGDYKKAYDQGKTFITLCVIVGVLGAGVLLLLKSPVISIFNVSEETVYYSKQIINVMCVLLSFMLMDNVLTKGILRGGGDTKFLIFGDTVFTYIISVPLGYLAAFVLDLPIWAVFLCLKMDSVCKAVVCVYRFSTKKWIKNVTVSQ